MRISELGRGAGAVLVVLVALASPSRAADRFPDRTVQLVVPVGPGGGTDLLARQTANKLSQLWGQSIVVENRAGGGGIIGAQFALKSPADGYTLFFTHDGVITATPVLYRRADYDPIKQFAPISLLATMPYLVVVNPSVPAKSIPELISLMKEMTAKDESLGFATSALGSADHLSGERFKNAAGVDMLVVPYKESVPAMTDVIAGHLPMGFFSIPPSQPQVRAGTLRALGVTSSNRLSLFPELPTVSETIPGFVTGAWYGLFAPAGTPAAIVEKISNDVRQVVNSPEMAEYMAKNGFEARTTTPAEFAEFIKNDSAKTAEVIHTANVRLQ
jgi:tripartite-type tricarboxylate transporter receptor subunit TctC